jgi:hypothetical protein
MYPGSETRHIKRYCRMLSYKFEIRISKYETSGRAHGVKAENKFEFRSTKLIAERIEHGAKRKRQKIRG